jgi:hypothetical protein
MQRQREVGGFVKNFILHPWEDDLKHLRLRQIAKLEGLDQQTAPDHRR